VLALGLVAGAIALAVVNIVLLLVPGSSKSQASRETAREQVLAAAKSETALVISYDYRSVEAGAAKALPHLTGAFAADYRKSIDSVIKVQAPKVKAIVEGQIDTAGIEAVSGTGKQVTLVVFGQQKVTNSTLGQPRLDLVRLRVTMDNVDGQWKISKLDQI
jgi:Mce-associated membrane protein